MTDTMSPYGYRFSLWRIHTITARHHPYQYPQRDRNRLGGGFGAIPTFLHKKNGYRSSLPPNPTAKPVYQSHARGLFQIYINMNTRRDQDARRTTNIVLGSIEGSLTHGIMMANGLNITPMISSSGNPLMLAALIRTFDRPSHACLKVDRGQLQHRRLA